MTGRAPVSARLAAVGLGAAVVATDLLPPRIRYGYVHPAARAVLRRPLPSLDAAVSRTIAVESDATPATETMVALAADHLDVGGIGSVIETLATGLGPAGIRAVVVCPDDGVRARRLRAAGVDVVTSDGDIRKAFAEAAVIQLHSAPRGIEDAALLSGTPLVTVMHNTEIHFTQARWRRFRAVMAESEAGIAVSETVRAFHARRLPTPLHARLHVVPNGAAALSPARPEQRRAAREALAQVLGTTIGDDIVFVCLARYDSQKNIAGMVASFARAATRRPGIRLVCAGDPSDWLELRRADAIRRAAGRVGDRVHLLGNSDAATLLTAADAFLLDSFFEGWAVAATEAAMAGLPLVLSDVGGACELVAADPDRYILIPNPSGDASAVSDRRVAAARRAARRQRNADDLAAAIARLTIGAAVAPPSDLFGPVDMIEGHAAVLLEAGRAARH